MLNYQGVFNIRLYYYSVYKNINLKLIYDTFQQAENNIRIINFTQILQISVELCLIFHHDH